MSIRITSPDQPPADMFKVNGLALRQTLLPVKKSRFLSSLGSTAFGVGEMFYDDLFSYCTKPADFMLAAYLNCHHALLDKVSSAINARSKKGKIETGMKLIVDGIWWLPLAHQQMIANSGPKPGLSFFPHWRAFAATLPSLGTGSSANDLKRRIRIGSTVAMASVISAL